MNYNSEEKTITTERLLLRLFQPSDAEVVTVHCNNYEVYKNTLYLPYPYGKEDALSWMRSHYDNFTADKSYEFAITDKSSGELYGAIALSNQQTFNHGEIAYWIGEPWWGNGYATEAAQAILQFAFNEKHYHKVFARYFQTNPASGRVLQKLGMQKEGVLRDHIKKEGQFLDLIYVGLINPAC